MWVMSVHGFFSAVSKTPGNITIRARVPEQLEALIAAHPAVFDGVKVTLGGGTDYPARVTVPAATFVTLMGKLAEEVTYYNFKDEVHKREGKDKTYGDFLMRVWSVGRAFEDKVHPPKRGPSLFEETIGTHRRNLVHSMGFNANHLDDPRDMGPADDDAPVSGYSSKTGIKRGIVFPTRPQNAKNAPKSVRKEKVTKMTDKDKQKPKTPPSGMLVEDTTMAGGTDAHTGREVVRPKAANGSVDEATNPTDAREKHKK